MTLLSPEQLKDELAQVTPADPMVAGNQPFSYIALSADDFERLGYALFDAASSFRGPDDWTSATLMLRGSDAGRDVALFRQQRLVGVVQCKRLESGMTLPAVLRELAKLVLFPHADSSLPKIEAGLRYLLMLSRDPAGTVVDFFDRPVVVLASKASAISDAVDEALEAYSTLAKAFPDPDRAYKLVADALPTLRYQLLRPHALDIELTRLPAVAGIFFRQRVVVDNTVLQGAFAEMQTVLATIAGHTEGVALLTDVDLRILKARIENTPESHRLNLGFAATFGLPQEMFAGEDALRRRAGRILDLTQEISKDLRDWVFEQAFDKADAIALYSSPNTHPFARQAARAFMALVARDALQTPLASGKMADFAEEVFGFRPATTDDERLEIIHQQLFEQGRRYLVGDWSELAGDADMVEEKKQLIRIVLLRGITDEAELDRQLAVGIDFLKPHLISVADEIRRLGSHPVSIVVTGMDSLGSSDVMDRMAETLRGLNRGVATRRSRSDF